MKTNPKKVEHTKLYEWREKAKYDGVCVVCGSNVQVTVDHIIPMHFIDGFALDRFWVYNWEENYQLLCRPHNTMKANRIDMTNPKTIGLLETLLTEAKKLYQP